MTTDERRAEFARIFAAMPGPKNIDRLRQVAGILHVKDNTVRIWRLRNPTRVIPERSLAILRDAVKSA